MEYFVLFQEFGAELARVGEAPTLELAVQLALAVYNRPPTTAALKRLRDERWVEGAEEWRIDQPVVAVYQRFPDRPAAQVFWIGLAEGQED